MQETRRHTPATDHLSWRSSLLAGAIALVAYLVLAPTVTGDKDAAEFTLVLGAGGVAHPSGYPLFTLLGHPFVKLLHAMGATWAYAANAWSALGGALAIMLLHRLARRLVPHEGSAAGVEAWLPVLLFAFNPIWTYEATLAETGSWHVAWAAGAALLALGLLEAMAGKGAHTAAHGAWRRGALAWGLVCGLGLAHHLTALLFLAPLSFALARAAGRRRLTTDVLLLVVAGALAPLLSYGYIAWRAFHPGAVQWPTLAPSWRAVFDHISAAQYRGYFGAYKPSPGQAANLARYVYPFVGVAAVALALAIRRLHHGSKRTLLWAVAAGCVIQTGVILAYGVPDPGSYFLPVLGLGLTALAPMAAAFGWLRRNAVLALVVIVAVFGALDGYWLKVNADRRALYVQQEQVLRGMWSAITVDQAFVLWHSDMIHQLLIWQVLDGEKPNLVICNPAMLTHPWPRRQFTQKYGFDPVEGLVSPNLSDGAAGARMAEGIARRVNAQSPLPVIEFDGEKRSVRMLKKPDRVQP